jgi:RHS repeat-associated protein
MTLPGSPSMPGGAAGVPDVVFGLDGRPMASPAMGTIGSYTGMVGMIAFPPDGLSGVEGGIGPKPLIEYDNDGIAWPNEVGMVQAGYEKEQFRPMGMAVIPAPPIEQSTGLNQFGESTIDRWHEMCASVDCGPAQQDAANAPHDERVADPPPQDVCACGIYTEDNYDPAESKKQEIICSGLVQTKVGPDAGTYTSGNIEPPDLRRVTQYSILGTNISSYKDLRSDDQGHTFEPFAQWTRSHTSGNQAYAGLDLQALQEGGTTTVAVHPRYDTRGNLRDEGTSQFADSRRGRIFEYDVFSNLTGVYARNSDGTAGLILARFTYDASGHRSSATYNANVLNGTDPADSTLANDFTDLYIYDAQWRVRAVLRREAGEIDDPNVTTWVRERWVYHQSGDGEGAFGTGPTGDDAPAARFLDGDGDGDFETVQHFLCNRRGDVVAVVGPGIDGDPNDGVSRATIPGALIARVWYDDYGMPRVYAATDIDHNGVSDENDLAEFTARYQIGLGAQSSDEATRREAQRYRNQLDWDRDGVVGPNDLAAFAADLAGEINQSRDVVAELGNLPLYAGYWWDAALELYHVRHRVYDPRLGRWLQRDPLGYAAGSNLYSYVMNQPGRFVDPLGLRWAQAGGESGGTPPEPCSGEHKQAEPDDGWLNWIWRNVLAGTGSPTLRKTVDDTRLNLLKEVPINAADASLSMGTAYVISFIKVAGDTAGLSYQAVFELAAGGTLGGAVGAKGSAKAIVEIVEDVQAAGGWIARIREIVSLKRSSEISTQGKILVGPYEVMAETLKESGQQAGHLNQVAAFKGLLERDASLAVPLRGSTNEIGSEHRKFHEVLEAFWDKYRTNTSASPKVHEYTDALGDALRATGRFSDKEASLLVDFAKEEIASARSARYPNGLGPNDLIPRVPGRIPGVSGKPPCPPKGATP